MITFGSGLHCLHQETSVRVTFGRHALKCIYSESSCREVSIDICTGPIGGEGGGGGGLGGVRVF